MAFIAPQVTGVPSSGVVAANPCNFFSSNKPIAQINLTQANVGDDYLDTVNGLFYKLYNVNGTRSWVQQGITGTDITGITTDDSATALPDAAGIIVFAQGNGTLTTSSGSTSTITMASSYTGTFTINATAAAALNVTSTSSDTTASPIINLYRNRAAPAAADLLGEVIYSGKNSTPAQKSYALKYVTADAVTAGAESGSWRLQTISSGTLTTQLAALSTGCQIRGNNTNTAAPAGYIGEFKSQIVLPGSAVTLAVSTTVYNIATISLTPGNWWVWGTLAIYTGGAATVSTASQAGISGTSATLPATLGYQYFKYNAANTGTATEGINQGFPLPGYMVSVASTTSYYLVASCTFTVAAPIAFGSINALRLG
jgi:hypothetical protein